MKKFVYGMAAAAAMFTATSANAAIQFFPGSTGGLTGGTVIADFDPNRGTLSGVEGRDFVIQNNTDSEGAMTFNLQNNYLSVLAGGTATFNFATPLNNLSFAYGSADAFNTLTVLFAGGSQTFTGSDIVGAGNATGSRTAAASNGTVFLSGFQGGITGLRLTSSGNSFEIDNLRANAVPEPGTWAMMLMGFGAVGFAMRRTRVRKLLPQAA